VAQAEPSRRFGNDRSNSKVADGANDLSSANLRCLRQATEFTDHHEGGARREESNPFGSNNFKERFHLPVACPRKGNVADPERSLLRLGLGFDIFNAINRFTIENNMVASDCFDEDLHFP
jgi:hypothetical protein